MKMAMLALFVISACSAPAQDMSRIGFVSGGLRASTPQEIQQHKEAAEKFLYERSIRGGWYRWVGTNLWDIRGNPWITLPDQLEEIRVHKVTKGGVIFDVRFLNDNDVWEHEKYIFVKNYPNNSSVTGDEPEPIRLFPISSYDYINETIAGYDYG